MAGVPVLHQEHTLQVAMAAAESLQFPDVVLGVLAVLGRHLHPSTVDDQEEQQVDRAVAGVLELLLLDRAGDGSPDRVTFQHLVVGLLVHGHHPDALAGQPFRIGIAPKDLLRPLLELFVETRRLPVAGPVRLQVCVFEDLPDRAWADSGYNAIGDRLASQILAGPVGDVQPLGDGLQAGQFDDLGTL
jgi:hypothetical protein